MTNVTLLDAFVKVAAMVRMDAVSRKSLFKNSTTNCGLIKGIQGDHQTTIFAVAIILHQN